MLKDSTTERIINRIGVAENAKIEGISLTARRLLHTTGSIFDEISEFYKQCEEDKLEENNVIVGIRKFGFTVTLPYTMLYGFVSKLGADIKTIVDMAREESNISTLVSNGIIKQEEVPVLLEKISQLDSKLRLDSGYLGVGGIMR